MGAVFDHRMKLKLLEYCYSKIDHSSSKEKTQNLKKKLYHLYEEYKMNDIGDSLKSKSSSSSSEVREYECFGGGGRKGLGRGLNLDLIELAIVDSMTKVCPLLTIGPTLPSSYLDVRIENDNKYDINLFHSETSTTIINWLDKKPPRSVVYIAFGSMDNLPKSQMEEIAWGLHNTNFDFLWVVRASDKEKKIPADFVRLSRDKALFVHWSPQLEVLSNQAIGCFFSHGGWNSTTEALSLGVPMVVMPQWTDQTTDAKLVQDLWGVGIRVRVGADDLVGRDEVEGCVREVMEGERGEEMKRNASKWKDLAKEAVGEGGTSDVDIVTLVSKLTNSY